jgi:hypothetical protein
MVYHGGNQIVTMFWVGRPSTIVGRGQPKVIGNFSLVRNPPPETIEDRSAAQGLEDRSAAQTTSIHRWYAVMHNRHLSSQSMQAPHDCMFASFHMLLLLTQVRRINNRLICLLSFFPDQVVHQINGMPGKDVCGGSSDIFLFYLQRGRYIMDSSTYDIIVYHGGYPISTMFCDWSVVRKRGNQISLTSVFGRQYVVGNNSQGR